MSIATEQAVIDLEKRIATLEQERAVIVNAHNDLLNRVVALENNHTLKLKRG